MAEDAKRLWQQFAMLTEEMRKFLSQDDIDEYVELGRQRNIFFERIQSLAKDDYRNSEEGKALLARLKPIEAGMIRDAQMWLNKSRNHNNKVQGYGAIGGMRLQGNIFNKGF